MPKLAEREDHRIDSLLRAAEVHGKVSEPDHEVGDLQGMLRSAWEQLSAEGRQRVWDEAADVVAWLHDDD